MTFFRLASFILLPLLIASPSVATEGSDKRNLECDELLLSEQEKLVRHYLYLNMAFPQTSTFIRIGLTAYYFAHLKYPGITSLEILDEGLTQRVWNVMTRAHQAHGINRDLDINMSNAILRTFIGRNMAQTVVSTINFMLVPDSLPFLDDHDADDRTRARLNLFFTSPKYRDVLNQLVEYSKTILAAMKGPKVRELSSAYRDYVVQGGSPINSKHVVEARNLIVVALEQSHPELSTDMYSTWPINTFQSDLTSPAKSRAEVMIWALTGSPIFLYHRN